MIPVFCRVKHDPENGMFGDCVRAVVASILEIDIVEDVPHFFEDNCDGETGHARMREFLLTKGLVPFTTYYPGSISLDEVLKTQHIQNPGVCFILFCQAGGGDHVVICKDGKVVHNPSWVPCNVSGPNSNGHWGIMVFVKQ